jgi:predicted RNA-binding protein YlxR (DUF448 family)
MKLIYCYGIVENPVKINKNGFEEGKIYTVLFKDIYAIVSEVSDENFSQEVVDKNVKDIKWVTLKGKLHEGVIDSIMENATIIPMKFCTIFKTGKGVEAMLEEKYADLKYNLNNLKGKVEMGVKVYTKTDILKQQISEKSYSIKRLKEDIKSKTPGRAYFIKQTMETLLKEKLQKKLAIEKEKIFNRIKTFAEESKQNELLNKKLTGKDMLLNGVFLIKKEHIGEFKNYVEKIGPDYLNFELTIWGPFPPYNFVK